MRQLVVLGAFKRDWKRMRRSGKCSDDDVAAVTELLRADRPLPERMRDHALSGQWVKIGARECHVKPDVLLVYAKPENALQLLRLTSHSELF